MSKVLVGVAVVFLLGLAIGNAVTGPTDDFPIALVALLAAGMGLAWFLRTGRRSAPDEPDVSGWRAIERELSRARRMERSFAVARIVPAANVDAGGREPLLRAVRRSIRDIDAGWWAGNDILLMLSETPSAAVGPLMKRLEVAAPSFEFAWSVAEYPRDGLTLPALLAAVAAEESAPAAQLEVSDGAV